MRHGGRERECDIVGGMRLLFLSNFNVLCVVCACLGDMDAIQDYLLKLTGARSVPRVFIKDRCIGGGSETRDLHQKNKLVPMLKGAGAL